MTVNQARASSHAWPVCFFFSTPVWGAGHLGLFLTVGLPSLLSKGNLPGLANRQDCCFYIYTRAEDEAVLRASPAFQMLAELMPVEVSLIREAITEPHRTMSDCHIDTMRQADEAGVAAVFLPPDCVWSDGSMTRLEAIAKAGKSVVHISGVRTDRDAIVPHLKKHLSDGDRVLTVAAQPLVELGLKHLHPIAFTHYWNEHDGGLMPANLYWTVAGEGLALRCFHLHPLMVKSQVPFAKFASTIDDDLALTACPDVSRDYIVGDSDEILAFEMSGRDRIVGTVCDKNSIDGVAGWAEFGTNRRHRNLGRHAIRLHYVAATERIWQPIEAEGKRVIDAIVRLNDLPTYVLATESPKVLAGRMYAVSLGRGEYAERDLRLAKRIVAAKDKLLEVHRSIYSRLFLKAGETRMTHPMWLVRQSTLAALLDCVKAGEKSVVVLNSDISFAHHMQRARPDLEVRGFAGQAELELSKLRSEVGADADLAVVIDIEERGPIVPPKTVEAAANVARRAVWLRLGANGAVASPPAATNFETRWFGGTGTRTCHAVWVRARTLRAGRNANTLSLRRLTLKAVGLLAMPGAYALGAVAGLGLNVFGLALDKFATTGHQGSTGNVAKRPATGSTP